MSDEVMFFVTCCGSPACAPQTSIHFINGRGALNITTTSLPYSQVSMTYIERYTLPYLCCLGLGVIVLVYMAAAVLTVILLRLLFVPQTVAACMQGVLPGA
jgi:hypothetical protein